jgi:hypothetical protein
MKSVMRIPFAVWLGLLAAVAVLAIFGMNGLTMTVALACVAMGVGLANMLSSWRRAETASDYELNLLARLDSRDPTVHHQAELERDLQDWRQKH